MAMTLQQFARYSQTTLPEKFEQALNQIQRKAAFDLYAGVLKRSPVDTGRYRGNWSVAVNSPKRAVIESVPGERPPRGPGEPPRRKQPASGAETSSASAAMATARAPTDVIWLSNNLPYAEALERGRIGSSGSPQAPEGVAQVTITSVLGQQVAPVIKLP